MILKLNVKNGSVFEYNISFNTIQLGKKFEVMAENNSVILSSTPCENNNNYINS